MAKHHKEHKEHKTTISSNKAPSHGLADLNYFIKTIEKDLSDKLKTRQDLKSMPNTPSSLIKKVGDQMKALGVDPRLWKQVEAQELRKTHQRQAPPPQVKLLALNQIVKSDDSVCTPSNLGGTLGGGKLHKTSSPNRHGPRGSDSDGTISEGTFCKTQRLDKKGVLSFASVGEQRTHRERTDEVDKLSSARGATSNYSGGRNQMGIQTERSS